MLVYVKSIIEPSLYLYGLLVMVCEVFPAGSDDYEAMASLGRMVAQCGPGIEDIVRQRKPQDPSLWYEGSQRSTFSKHTLLLLIVAYNAFNFNSSCLIMIFF